MMDIKKLKRTEKHYQLVLDNLKNLSQGAKILEVGAGQRILKKFLPTEIKYYTLDFGKEYDYNFDLDKGKFPIENGQFDVVVCMETLEHVMYPDKVLKEIIRVAKKNAIFFFSLPNEYNFYLRLCYLFGKKTDFDKPFKVVSEHLHIHKPRVKDALSLFSEYFDIQEVKYFWHSRQSVRSNLFYFGDIILNTFAQIYPPLFTRGVIVRAVNKKIS